MTTVPPVSQIGDPPWEIATLFPPQGAWSEAEYLALTGNRLIELCDGKLEVLPVPTQLHQMIVAYLYETIKAFVVANDLGKVLFAPLRVRVRSGRFREPDVLFMSKRNAERRGNQYWEGADLVVEVVSEDDPDRDWKTKRAEYAEAGIPEYWIVDPRDESITVLTLPQGQSEYAEAGKYARGEAAASVLLDGLSVKVDEVFSQS